MSDIYVLQPPPPQKLVKIYDKALNKDGEILDRCGVNVLVRWGSDDYQWVSLCEKFQGKKRFESTYED